MRKKINKERVWDKKRGREYRGLQPNCSIVTHIIYLLLKCEQFLTVNDSFPRNTHYTGQGQRDTAVCS